MVTCKRGCGSTDLHWKIVEGKYKLFSNSNLIHICNDGDVADKPFMEKITKQILTTLNLKDVEQIPLADDKFKEEISKDLFKETPKHFFTINSTASGISVTGDDKHTAIYIPKVAVPDLAKALIDFI